MEFEAFSKQNNFDHCLGLGAHRWYNMDILCVACLHACHGSHSLVSMLPSEYITATVHGITLGMP